VQYHQDHRRHQNLDLMVLIKIVRFLGCDLEPIWLPEAFPGYSFASGRHEGSIFLDSRQGAKLTKFGEIGMYFSLRSWRPFDLAQDGLGATNFIDGVLPNILLPRI
jgi:hypothetical protein